MPKRIRRLSLDDSGESCAEGKLLATPQTESDVEDSDASFAPNTKGRRSKKRKLKFVSKDTKISTGDSTGSDPREISTDTPPHPKTAHTINSSAPMRTALLGWYKVVHDTRGMPWRRAYNPNMTPAERGQRAYEVWISEIMLQQTQVATVIPYYNRWMAKFPTIRELAAASIDEVNGLWKGLGYYKRASRLLAAAQKVIKEFDGTLPDNAKDMESKIPGIGRYSAGAICSIAYGEKVPVLDGNVHRLLSRLLALHAPPKSKTTLDILWAAARTMVEIEDDHSDCQTPQYPGDINQALIELGSTVCKVNEPNCGICPMQSWCAAYRRTTTFSGPITRVIPDIEDICRICEPVTSEEVTSYPMKAERKKSREELDIVSVMEWRSLSNPDDRQFLMVRRPESGLLAGLYEFPTIVNTSKNISSKVQERLTAELLLTLFGDNSSSTHATNKPKNGKVCREKAFTICKIQYVGDVTHIFSHLKKIYRVQWVLLESDYLPEIQEHLSMHERPTKKLKKGRLSEKVNFIPQIRDVKTAKWVSLNEVMETNMGSGVVKVWNLTKRLWEDNLTVISA